MQWSSVSNLQHSRRSVNSLGMILIIVYIISKLRVAFSTLAVLRRGRSDVIRLSENMELARGLSGLIALAAAVRGSV